METQEISKGHEEKWAECLAIIKDILGPDQAQSYRTWFEPIKFVDWSESTNQLTIQVPSEFYYEYLEENYIDLISRVLHRVYNQKVTLKYNVWVKTEQKTGRVITTTHTGKNTPAQNIQPAPTYIPNSNIIKDPFILPGVKGVIESQLNPTYTFANFVEGDCNKLARTAGLTIARYAVKTTYNPLLIYGKSGLGKTHLIQAIGSEIKELYPKKNVLYVDADTFERQHTQAAIENHRNDFLHYYQNIDVLIIDDVQLFKDKVGTQNAFFQIFNYLHQKGKQIILSSDCPPVEMQGLNDRLLSRFKWGLSAELTVPNFETRLEILKQKIQKEGIEIDEEVMEYIANHITSNIRELEGVLISILAQATINKKQLSLDLAKDVVEKLVKSTQQDISIEFIKKTVCDYFNIAPDQLKSKTRKREIVQSRQVAMYFAKIYTKNSLASIGSQIGGKDHATVLHACKTVNNLMETDKRFKKYILDLEKRFKLQ
ncbi:MAG: chromosomal replication initiator protein DnaA [Bacteroidales bacterium]|nr:chromosomal replication initiator protein DnaA [Bacteroidales bacterium]MBQ3676662.1 chromosomal replication initiator protein DnaA [Bacteroidales bacterium]MBQ4214801.1 chromosomal replication initiator protein DnaA [Bacteroidales bacterium]MBR4498175.1 chromosomal replication initiator protein DnaA [Bacteroidales bacterium]